MVSFEIFVKSMPPSLSELKITPSFCFPFKIPDDPTATNTYICYQLWKQHQYGNYLTTIQLNNEILHLFITSAILVNPMDVFSNICIDTRKIRVCTSNAKWYNSNNIHFKCSIESDLKQNLSPFMVIKNLQVPTSYHRRIGTYVFIIIAAY